MSLPANQLPIGSGRGPDGQEAFFYVDADVLDALDLYGPDWMADDSRFVPEAVAEPDAIFDSLVSDGRQGLACWSVRPTRDPQQSAESGVLPRYGFVFLAFARPCFGGYLVVDWEWRAEDAGAPGHPANWRNFGSRTWQPT